MASKTVYAHKYTEDGEVMEDIQICRVFEDKKYGTIFRVDGMRDYFHFRMTPSGLLRHGPIIKRGEKLGVINGG